MYQNGTRDYDASGRRRPIPVKGSEFRPGGGYDYSGDRLPAGTDVFASDKGFVITKAGTLSSDPITMATQIPGVFATGMW